MPAFPNFGKTLVYVETNERGLEAARYAIAFAKRSGGELHAVAVINERILEELTRARVFLKEEGIDLKRDLEEDGRRYLALMERLAGKKGWRSPPNSFAASFTGKCSTRPGTSTPA